MTEILAIVADLYTSTLLIVSLVLLFRSWQRHDKLAALQLALIAVCTYGFMYLDKKLKLWASLDLDYSTHSAAALGLILFIAVRTSVLTSTYFLISLIGYAGLMIFLNYHSAADILTTGFAVLPFYIAIIFFTRPTKTSYPLFSRN